MAILAQQASSELPTPTPSIPLPSSSSPSQISSGQADLDSSTTTTSSSPSLSSTLCAFFTENRTVQARYVALGWTAQATNSNDLLEANAVSLAFLGAAVCSPALHYIFNPAESTTERSVYHFIVSSITSLIKRYPSAVRWLSDGIVSAVVAFFHCVAGPALYYTLFVAGGAVGVMMFAVYAHPILALYWAVNLHTLSSASFLAAGLPLPLCYLIDQLLLFGPSHWYINLHNAIFTYYYPYLHLALAAHVIAGMFDLTPSSFAPSSVLKAVGLDVSVRWAGVREMEEQLKENRRIIKELEKRVEKAERKCERKVGAK